MKLPNVLKTTGQDAYPSCADVSNRIIDFGFVWGFVGDMGKVIAKKAKIDRDEVHSFGRVFGSQGELEAGGSNGIERKYEMLNDRLDS